MPHEHPSGLPNAIDRAINRPDQQSVVFYGDSSFLQGAELNDLQRIARGRHDRVSRLIAKDGNRISGAMVFVDGSTVTLTKGEIFVSGDVFPISEAIFTSVPVVGTITFGVVLTRSYITHEDDPSLLGLVPGSDAEGEPGAAREVVSIAWGRGDQPIQGEYYAVYTLTNGTIIDQTPPPLLDGIAQQLAIYDRPHGHYIVSGCRVTPLGISGGKQVFSIEEGEANINGFKRTRHVAIRHEEPEDWDEFAVPGETHTYAGGASHTLTLDRSPLAEITSILLTKEKTVTITRGAVGAGQDTLPDTSVISLLEVKQGGTTYVATTDFIRTGNNVDWAPAGAEPLPGSSYTVKYRYRSNVTATTFTPTTVTVSNGASGGDIIIGYKYKAPRYDALCLDQNGSAVYVKGRSADSGLLPPPIPADLLQLCTIKNDWRGTPSVINSETRFISVAQQNRLFNSMLDLMRVVGLERLRSIADSNDPIAKLGHFADPFEDDTYRDTGEPQSASVGNRVMQLAIQPTFYVANLNGPVTLNYVPEIISQQPLKTGCVKINEYANFTPLPGEMRLDPAADFWTSSQTVWASPVTLEFNLGVRTVFEQSTVFGTQTTTRRETTADSAFVDGVTDFRRVQSQFLRVINVNFTISGFGIGEILSTLTFDGINIKPPGTIVANGLGQITGSFLIPNNVTVGSKIVIATGAGGTSARAIFTGGGVIDVTTMRRTTTITRRTTDTTIIGRGFGGGGQSGRGLNSADPQAQLFAVDEPRQMIGVDFHLCAIGNTANSISLNQVTVDNGYPTSDVEAETLISMAGAVVGWKRGLYPLPLYTGPEAFHAFVLKTDDNSHSISLAGLGQFDASLQQRVTEHPYITGPRFSSVNAETWTSHQAEALSFRLLAARYTALSKTVALGSFNLVNASDFQIRASIEIPSSDCDVVFEVERANGTIYRVRSHQVVKLSEFITETVVVRMILTGTEKLSPIVFAPVVFIAGKIATSGTYVSRTMPLGTAVSLTAYIKAHLPSGSSLNFQYDKADGTFLPLPLVDTKVLQDPRWVEQKFKQTNITAVEGRLKITLTGSPAARPELYDLSAAIV